MSITKKIKRAIKDPRRIAAFSKRITGKATRKPYYYFYKKIDKTRRKKLLSLESDRWKTVRTYQPDLSKMSFHRLSQTLKRMNEEVVDWESKKSQLSNSRNGIDVSVIVLVLNNIDMTVRCLDSIIHSKNKAHTEIIVVDNGSSANTITGLRTYLADYPEVKLLHIDQNVNFALGNNIGFLESKGAISIFLNNDTYVTEDGWVDRLIRPLSNPEVKTVQPTLLYPDNTIQCIGITFSEKSDIGYGPYVGKKQTDKVVKNRRARAVTGACLAIRAVDFLDAKGFDPIFINGQEDVDLCLRVGSVEGKMSGYVTATAIVYHDEGKTPGRGKFVSYNRQVFLGRWGGKIVADDRVMYKKDGYEISRWKVDFQDFKEKGIEVYLPVLRKRKDK